MSSDSNPLQSFLSNILSSLRSGGNDELRHSDHRSGTVRRQTRGGHEELVADLEAQQDLYARRGGNSIEVHQHQSASATVRRRKTGRGGRLPHGSDRRLPGDIDDESGEALDHFGGEELGMPFDGEVVSYQRTVHRTVKIRGNFRGSGLRELEDELRPDRELPQSQQRELAVPKKFWLPAAQPEAEHTTPTQESDASAKTGVKHGDDD
ncbi:MAG: hypothetical protein SX243_02310 [Acidobacteriota bacterium]|nr:hypothetical protein [Acidobacteriota bacterium]